MRGHMSRVGDKPVLVRVFWDESSDLEIRIYLVNLPTSCQTPTEIEDVRILVRRKPFDPDDRKQMIPVSQIPIVEAPESLPAS